MADKRTHFGRAGEFFAMSELLLRGWNVAVPVVDVGDDVFVIDDNDKTTFRLQVKSAESSNAADSNGAIGNFRLSRSQLNAELQMELFYMLLIRVKARWRYLVIPRPELSRIRSNFVEPPSTGKRIGRPPVTDAAAMKDALMLRVTVHDNAADGWNADLSNYLERWPDRLAPVTDGPGAVGGVTETADLPDPELAMDLELGPAPIPDHEK